MATDDLFQKALECDRRKDGFGLEEALRASALADLRNGEARIIAWRSFWNIQP